MFDAHGRGYSTVGEMFNRMEVSMHRLIISCLLCFSILPVHWALAATPQTRPVLRAERIVSLVPQATEALFAFGAQDQVIGVSSSSQWPEAAKSKPQVGGVLDAQIEQIIQMNPDLVILSRNHILHNQTLRQHGIRTLTISTESINDALQMMHDLSFIVGREKVAEANEKELLKDLNAMANRYKDVPRKKVLISFYHEMVPFEEVLAVGGANYIDEVVRTAGGLNVVAAKNIDGGIGVKLMSAQIAVMHPDVVIDLLPADETSDEQKAAIEAQWRQLVGDKARIYVVHEPYLGVPGTRIPLTIERMAAWIHGTVATRPSAATRSAD